jgi:hypothetical protein
VFAVDGGLDSFVRIPYSRPPDELRLAVDRLVEARATLAEPGSRPAPRAGTRRTRVMVA